MPAQPIVRPGYSGSPVPLLAEPLRPFSRITHPDDRPAAPLRLAPLRAARLLLILLVLLVLLVLLCSALCLPASAQPPQELRRSQITYLDIDTEQVEGAFPGMLAIPRARPNYRDEKYGQPYHLACHIYVGTPGADSDPAYTRRFLVCAASRDALPLVRRVARMLLCLYGERRTRIHDDHSEQAPTVNVWLTERVGAGLSPDTGGEQFQNQIYLYDIHRERSDTEWAREIAHEYGHYALSGIAGYESPEEWANGVLGERLFLKWLRDDLRAGRMQAQEIPFCTPESLDDYFSTAIWPLIRRVVRNGIDVLSLTRTDAAAMDYYTGLAMAIDQLYGSDILVGAMQDTVSASRLTLPRARDFLLGFQKALKSESQFTLSLPALGDGTGETVTHLYLPAGLWKVEPEGGVTQWRMLPDAAAGLTSSGSAVRARAGGWYRVAYRRSPTAPPARLLFHRSGSAR